ncbi:hypothetical protein SCG7086_AC_00240 [Chlamydiales bacterium SCGC AG-110-P3]|nr:hypothetical protein SCG7086_AC_00240 [Chlamydiales bacterium SCGC AG-110-P3]
MSSVESLGATPLSDRVVNPTSVKLLRAEVDQEGRLRIGSKTFLVKISSSAHAIRIVNLSAEQLQVIADTINNSGMELEKYSPVKIRTGRQAAVFGKSLTDEHDIKEFKGRGVAEQEETGAAGEEVSDSTFIETVKKLDVMVRSLLQEAPRVTSDMDVILEKIQTQSPQAGQDVIADIKKAIGVFELPSNTSWESNTASTTYGELQAIVDRTILLTNAHAALEGMSEGCDYSLEFKTELDQLKTELAIRKKAVISAVNQQVNKSLERDTDEVDKVNIILVQLALVNEVLQRLDLEPGVATATDAFSDLQETLSNQVLGSAGLKDKQWQPGIRPIKSQELAEGQNVGGMANLGNTCYLNSVMQMLRCVPGLKEEDADSDSDVLKAVRALCAEADAASGYLSPDRMQAFFSTCLDNGWDREVLKAMPAEREAVANLLGGTHRVTALAAEQMDADEFFLWLLPRLALAEPIQYTDKNGVNLSSSRIETTPPSLSVLNETIAKLNGDLKDAGPVTKGSLIEVIQKLDLSPMYRSLLVAQAERYQDNETKLAFAQILPSHTNEQLLEWGMELSGMNNVQAPTHFYQKIDRYSRTGLGAPKNSQPLDFTQDVTVAGKKYRAKTVVLHSGTKVSTGHYTTLSRGDDDSCIYYNDRELRGANAEQSAAQEKAYIILWEQVTDEQSAV